MLSETKERRVEQRMEERRGEWNKGWRRLVENYDKKLFIYFEFTQGQIVYDEYPYL